MRKMIKFQKSVLIFSIFALSVFLSWGITECFAAPTFYSTADPSHWSVHTRFLGNSPSEGPIVVENDFLSSGSWTTPAVAVTGRTGWIANNDTGTNGGQHNWTLFIFRQTFDLSGYDPSTANLSFKWAADDSGENKFVRGQWIPQFSLNGGAFTYYPGSSLSNRIPTYGLSSLVTLSGGFVSGWNTIDFYVEGNGETDGFALTDVSFTARPSGVPEPTTMLLLGFGIAGLAGARRFRK